MENGFYVVKWKKWIAKRDNLNNSRTFIIQIIDNRVCIAGFESRFELNVVKIIRKIDMSED